jgi:hypothetical protein
VIAHIGALPPNDTSRKAFERLTSRGVKSDTDVPEYPWGYIAAFQDPNRNRLQLRELLEAR